MDAPRISSKAMLLRWTLLDPSGVPVARPTSHEFLTDLVMMIIIFLVVFVGFGMRHRAGRIAPLDPANGPRTSDDASRTALTPSSAKSLIPRQRTAACTLPPHPRCVAFSKVADYWGTKASTRAALTPYPSPGCLPKERRLAEPPFDHRIFFFPGEAINKGSIRGPQRLPARCYMETGMDAARNIASCLLHGIRRRPHHSSRDNI